MRFAFSRATRAPDDERTILSRFAEVGYDGLQLKGNQYAQYLDEPERFLVDWPAPGAASAVITGGDLGDESMEKMRKTFAFAEATGSERVIFCHNAAREGLTDDDIREHAKRLSDVAAEATTHGLAFSLHHHFGQPVMRRADFDVFFGVAKGVGRTLDTAHAVKSGIEDVAELIESFGHVIDNFHLKDYADGEWKVLGEGAIDFVPIFAAIRGIGYDGWVSTDEESGADVLPAMHACLAFMKNGLGAASGRSGLQ